MNIIAVANQKGGVAKTTTAVNLAASLGVKGKKVLVVDLDPQGNATMGCGVEKNGIELSMLDVCLEECSLADAVVDTPFKNMFLVPANQDLTVAEVKMHTQSQAAFVLQKQFERLRDEGFEYILIDCPPALNILTVNAMVSAKHVIVPIQCEYYALEGLTALLNTISDLQKTLNKDLSILGFLRTMFDGRSRLATEVSEQLESVLKDKVFESVIPRNIRLAEAPSHGMPAYYYERSSKGAKAYIGLSSEVMRRLS